MKKLILSFCFLSFCLLTFGQTKMQVASFNIRQKNTHDKGNLWDDRKHALNELIKYHEFDIFGVQEAFKDQLDDMTAELPGFAHIGVGRDDGAEKGEYSAIFYNSDRFKLINNGTFWLSATDTQKPNKGWDAALPRICTWGIFQDKQNKKKFIFMNTHFDHIGVEARRESAKLILAKAKEFAKDLPLILTGDFNVDETNEAYFTLANSGVVHDAHDLAKIKYEPNSTFNGWGESLHSKGRIDHIFLTKPFTVRKFGILTDTYMQKFPSDHFPIVAEVIWPK